MLSLFDIVVVRFAFEDKPEVSKPRPAVVVGLCDGKAQLTFAKVTSHAPRLECPGEVQLLDWEDEGLAKPSTVRCSKLVALAENQIRTVVGHLTDRDASAVCAGLEQASSLTQSRP